MKFAAAVEIIQNQSSFGLVSSKVEDSSQKEGKMSQQQRSPAPHKPDNRVFASYPMPPKIDLINERPRRESQVERQLDNSIGGSGPFLPTIPEIKVSQQHEDTSSYESRLPSQNSRAANHQSSSETIYTAATTTTTNNSSGTRAANQLSSEQELQKSVTGTRTPERHSPQYKVSGIEFGYRSSPQSPSASMNSLTQQQVTQVVRQASPQPHSAQFGCHEHRIIISVGPICSRPCSSQQVDCTSYKQQETIVYKQEQQKQQSDREEWLRAQQILKEEQEILERQTRLEQKEKREREWQLQRQREEQEQERKRQEQERKREEMERKREQELLIEQQRLLEEQVKRQQQQQQQTTTTTTRTTVTKTTNAETLATELAAKEAKLRAEIAALHDRPYSPFQMPNKIDLTNEQRIAQQQLNHSPSPRPYSRASSTRSTTIVEDLLTKEAQLQREIEEIERKPFNPQTMVVEREQWFEYPEDRPHDKQLTESKRRIKDFCSQPSYMYPTEGKHIHEENIPAPSASSGRLSAGGDLHTAIIKGPKREVDNKSPLPFAFDNFSTKGVRGNIASACAIEPDRPRPPIYPIVKKSPSPNVARS